MLPPLPVIDCRPANEYQTGHIQGATHLPAAALFARMHELPQRTMPVQLCGTPQSLAEARSFLQAKGYQVAAEWLWDETLKNKLIANRKFETGSASTNLWQPAPLIAHFIAQQSRWHTTPGHGLDIACGAGRDMVYMAMHGWQMTGIDYLPGALQRASELAAHNRAQVSTLQLDLEHGGNPFPPDWQPFDFVCALRYLHRPLFPYLKSLIKPGGILLYQTFMQGCEKISSPRNPNFLLRPGELAETFAEFEILHDEVEHLADGRPVAAFIARKPL